MTGLLVKCIHRLIFSIPDYVNGVSEARRAMLLLSFLISVVPSRSHEQTALISKYLKHNVTPIQNNAPQNEKISFYWRQGETLSKILIASLSHRDASEYYVSRIVVDLVSSSNRVINCSSYDVITWELLHVRIPGPSDNSFGRDLINF